MIVAPSENHIAVVTPVQALGHGVFMVASPATGDSITAEVHGLYVDVAE